MQPLVHDGSSRLVRSVGSHTHPSAIRAVGSRCAGLIAHAGSEVAHLREVVPQVGGGVHGIGDTFAHSLVADAANGGRDGSHGDGVETDLVAISHIALLVLHIRAHEILGGGLQVLEAIDGAIVRERGGVLRIGHRGMGLRANHEALLLDIGSLGRGAHATEGHGGSTHIALVGHHLDGVAPLEVGGSCLEAGGTHQEVGQVGLLVVQQALSLGHGCPQLIGGCALGVAQNRVGSSNGALQVGTAQRQVGVAERCGAQNLHPVHHGHGVVFLASAKAQAQTACHLLVEGERNGIGSPCVGGKLGVGKRHTSGQAGVVGMPSR